MSYAWIDRLVMSFGFYRSQWFAYRTPNDQDFARLEAKLEGQIPAEYRYFLANYGGGSLGGETCRVEAPLIEWGFWRQVVHPVLFHSLGEGLVLSVDDLLTTSPDLLPKGVIPIAHDAPGNQICLDVAGEFPGYVWFWARDQDRFDQTFSGDMEDGAMRRARSLNYRSLYLMAETFADFLYLLRRGSHPPAGSPPLDLAL